MRPYRIYRNLTKKNYSIQAKVEGKWKKVDEADQVLATDCAFLVYEAGQRRVVKEKRKNVHAFVCCTKYHKDLQMSQDGQAVTYNPYKGPEFTLVDVKKRTAAPIYNKRILLSSGNMCILP